MSVSAPPGRAAKAPGSVKEGLWQQTAGINATEPARTQTGNRQLAIIALPVVPGPSRKTQG